MQVKRSTVDWQYSGQWAKYDPITESAKEGDSQFQSETRRRISKAEEKDKRER